MSFNGSGTYNLPAGNPVVSGTTIQSTWANSTLSDIAAALSNTVVRDGQAAMTGDLNLGNHNIVNALAATFAATVNCGGVNVTSLTVPANGLYSPVANAIALATAATQRIAINSTGNVIINAASTGVTLTATGAASQPAIQATINNATFNPTQNAALMISNGNVSAQTPLDWFSAGTITGRIRNDFNGNMAYVSFASGSHTFLVGGDATVGTASLVIAANRSVSLAAPSAAVNTLTVNGAATAYAGSFVASTSANNSYGVQISAGTSASDLALRVVNAAGSSVLLTVNGAGTVSIPTGGVVLGAATGGSQGAGTINATGLYINGTPAGALANNISGSYTTVLSDANGIVNNNTGSAKNVTIASNATVPYPVGTIITFANSSGFSSTLSINSDTLLFVPSLASGSRTIANGGIATALKVQSTAWFVSGPGVS